MNETLRNDLERQVKAWKYANGIYGHCGYIIAGLLARHPLDETERQLALIENARCTLCKMSILSHSFEGHYGHGLIDDHNFTLQPKPVAERDAPTRATQVPWSGFKDASGSQPPAPSNEVREARCTHEKGKTRHPLALTGIPERMVCYECSAVLYFNDGLNINKWMVVPSTDPFHPDYMAVLSSEVREAAAAYSLRNAVLRNMRGSAQGHEFTTAIVAIADYIEARAAARKP